MLIKDVVKNYNGQVEYRDENYGSSEFADRFGVKRYPAVFVDDALIARPDDFGFYGKDHDEKDKGRYTPWRDIANHKRFQKDLTRMIDMRLRGEEIESLKMMASSEGTKEQLPDFVMTTLDGTTIESKDLQGKVVLVEFWASWCPPCKRTLGWMSDVVGKYRDRVAVVAVAVESKEADVRELSESMGLSYPVAIGSDEQVALFGEILAVPTMYLFDRTGRLASIFYGAPPDLHEKADEKIQDILAR